MDHTIQRQTITSQRLGESVGPRSIARPNVLLYAVSPRVLPEAVTQAVTQREAGRIRRWPGVPMTQRPKDVGPAMTMS
jgi:hypothetical protein